MTKLSPHFTLEEVCASSTATRLGIRNVPPPSALANLTSAVQQLEAVRALLGSPVHVDSGFRSLALNFAVGGAANSAHLSGWAFDFVCPAFGTPLAIVKAVEASGIKFDQLIMEHNAWVHISFDPKMRQQVLTASYGPKGTKYTQGA